MKMRTLSPHSLISPKDIVLIGQSRATLIDHTSDWLGKASVVLVKRGFQELLYKGWLRWQEQSAGRQFSAGFSLKVQFE